MTFFAIPSICGRDAGWFVDQEMQDSGVFFGSGLLHHTRRLFT
jgi:hypothetical protein